MKTEVVVIGGGTTGAGILRDLAMRGIDAVLVEKHGLAEGTSGRFHGLLHSGARYVVKDGVSAKECIDENRILKRVAPHSVEATGGIYVSTTADDPAYIPLFLEGCERAGIEAKEVSLEQLYRDEPNITRDAVRAFYVPDGVVDGFSLVWSNIASALDYGARFMQYNEVIDIAVEDGAVKKVITRDAVSGEEHHIECRYVVNACGAWVNKIAELVGQEISVSPDLGTLLIYNHRMTSRVVNRLHKPANGDIIVPVGNVAILGTTSTTVDNPDAKHTSHDELKELIECGSHLIHNIEDYRIIRAFAGVRPLYTPPGDAIGRDATREFVLIDHSDKGVHGMVSVCGGKLTTYRLMAEKTVDYLAAKIGITEPCRTHEEVMKAPVVNDGYKHSKYLCKCENVTESMLDSALKIATHYSLNDVRKLTRLGMGPCQGTFCNYRATGYFNAKHDIPYDTVLGSLCTHVEERIRGAKPVLQDKQAAETEMMRAIYLGVYNLEREDFNYAI